MPAPTSLAPSSSRPSPSQPLQPSYILRSHSTVVSLLRFTRCGRFLLSADTDGYVVLWELRTRRARYCWKAHDGGVLGVDEFAGGVLTQGRDNNLRFFPLPPSASSSSSSVLPGAATAVHSHSSPTPGLSFDAPAEVGGPGMAWEMGVNAMTFCGMGLLRLPLPSGAGQDGKGKAGEEQALVAVVSLTKDEFVDILHLPSQSRLHRSIGSGAWGVGEKTGSVMALRLFHLAPPSSSSSSSATAGPKEQLHLLVAYESGQLALFRFVATSRFERDVETAVDRPVKGRLPDEGEGWELGWVEKGHRDAIMSLDLSPDKRFAYTVGADHYLSKYRVFDLNDDEAALPRLHQEATPSPGKSAVAVREDGKLVGTAGWDGEIRLSSARTLSPLAVLSHHRLSLQALAFAPLSSTPPSLSSLLPHEQQDDDSDDEDEESGRAWLAAAGQEGKISLWEVYPPKRSV